jgi:hypothetical protein
LPPSTHPACFFPALIFPYLLSSLIPNFLLFLAALPQQTTKLNTYLQFAKAATVGMSERAAGGQD